MKISIILSESQKSLSCNAAKLEDFATRMAALRKKRCLTQEKLAEQLGVSQEAVSRYEADKSMPTAANIAALAKLLDVSADYLLGLSEQEQSPKPLWEQLSPQKWEMLCNFKSLSAKAKERALGYLQGAADNR